MRFAVIGLVVLSAFAALLAGCNCGSGSAATAAPKDNVPLKDAKLNIEHNATDNDTGF